jgi:hypothetical protein
MAQKYTKIPGVEGPGIPRGKKELPKMTIDGAPGQSKMPSLPAIDDAD